MQVKFPYSDIPPLEVPDSNFLGYHHPKRVPGAPPAETPQKALELAFGMTSRKATVIAFHHGGEILPMVGGRGNSW